MENLPIRCLPLPSSPLVCDCYLDFFLIFIATRCSRSDIGESLRRPIALTWITWLWWVMIPLEDFTDVTLAIPHQPHLPRLPLIIVKEVKYNEVTFRLWRYLFQKVFCLMYDMHCMWRNSPYEDQCGLWVCPDSVGWENNPHLIHIHMWENNPDF